MAIDPRISLTPAPTVNVGQRFGQALNNLQNLDLLNTRRDLAPLQLEQAQRANELGIAQQPANLQAAEFAASGQSQALLNAEQANQLDLANARSLKPILDSGNVQGVIAQLNRQRQKAIEFNLGDAEVAEIDQAIQIAQTPNGLQQLKTATDSFLTPAGSQAKSVSQREFDANVAAVEADPKLLTTKGRAASIALGLTAKEALTKDERVARDAELGKLVADQKAAEAGAVEGAKLTRQLKFKPQITRAVKLAEKAAAEQGEVLTDLARAEAGLPGLIEATDNLKELATVATSTIGGRFFDTIAKESGWGSTKGANARAKYIAIIDNQVLPLLKQTFGAAMTEGEGLRLSNTLGDPNATPEQKMLQTEAFIEQKIRDIERLKSQAAAGQTPSSLESGGLNLPSAGNADVPSGIDIGTASIEELIAERKRLGGQ